MPDESKFTVMTEAEREALLTLTNAPDPNKGLPLNWRIGTLLVQRGWAELGLGYALYRITEHGRRALSVALTPTFDR
jgi:hypothetical protein